MNTATQQRLDELVGWLADTAKSTETFVLEQAPDVARQMVAWGFWSACTYLILWLALAAALLTWVAIMWPQYRRIKTAHDAAVEKSYEMAQERPRTPMFIEVFGIVRWVALGFGVLIVMAASTTNLPTIIKCTVAPKVYLIEEAAKMLR